MSDHDEAGRFAPGNRLWERASTGPAPRYETPEDLWAECVGYFEWVEENPLIDAQPVTFKGNGRTFPVDKMRAMTIVGLCVHIGIGRSSWDEWRNHRADLAEVIQTVEAIIWEQKFTGAAAGLLNANLISRELGLADKREHTGPDGGPIRTITTEMTPQEAAEAYAATLNPDES